MNIETTEQALERLKVHDNKFVKINENLFHQIGCDGEEFPYTARELIKFAKCYSSENRGETKVRKNLKHFSNSKNRSHTRDLIQVGDYDMIPSVNDPVATDDPWNWD